MAYLSACLTVPGIIAGICLSVSDIRSRTVPRAAVITGYIIQLSVFAAYAAAATAHLCDAAGFHDGHNPWGRLVSAVISSFICAGIQFALSMVRPGALGFGDTTATWLITLAVGWLGWTAAVWWWTVLGILGLAGLGAMKLITQARKARSCSSIGTKAKTDSLPFVPFITLSAVIVTAAYAAGIPL